MATSDLLRVGEVTPEFLNQWLFKTDSFYEEDDGLPRSVLNYGVDCGANGDYKVIMFFTADEKMPDFFDLDTIVSYPGGDWGENVYRELGERLERRYDIDLNRESALESKREYMKNQHKDFSEIDHDNAALMCKLGFNVFENGLDKKLANLDDFDAKSSIYYAPVVEIDQFDALCDVVGGLVSVYEASKIEAEINEYTIPTIRDFATHFTYIGNDDYPDIAEHIRSSIISGETAHLHRWLNNLLEDLPHLPHLEENQGISISDYRDALTQYEQTYRPNIDDLSRKVSAEYNAFIDDMKKQPPEVIIDAAYEITWKDAINLFIANEDVLLSQKQLQALLSSQNTLDEIFEQWLHSGELHTYSDIQTALDDTANNILTALDRGIVSSEEKIEAQEKAVALVDGELKDLPVVFDSQGADITGDFLKETVDNVNAYYKQLQAEENDPSWEEGAEYEDYPSTGMIAQLPPSEVEKEINFNPDTNRVEMSQAAFEWFEQYAPKHNKMSALENQLLAHIRATDKMSEYEFVATYRGSGDPTNLDEAADRKSEWLQDFAKEHSVAKTVDDVDEKPHKLSLSERIDKARAENPRTDAPKQDKQQTKNNSQEI